MRRYRKWVLTLGILAATPGLASAAPFVFGKPTDDADATSANAPIGKSKNQKTAEDVAVALKRAKFHGYEIDIECKDGRATLRGKVSDPRQKARASQIASSVPGVRRVENQLIVIASSRGQVRQVGGTEADAVSQGPSGADMIQANQEKAIQIGRALQSTGLNGYDVEVMYQNGQALLRGTVATAEQRAAAARAASTVPGVQAVTNQLRVEGQPAPSTPMPTAQGGPRYAMTALPPAGGPPAGPGAGVPPAPGGPPAMGVPMPAAGPIPNAPVYDNPHVPEYAWPSYAQYPNYAGVTYPSQYSASAWPYIGPFYPYPQVPLNWRKVTLEWDDGYWNLKFDSKTDRWWWFMHPKNW